MNKIIHHKPYARGVSQLMYVGDDEAVEKALAMRTVGLGIAGVVLWMILSKEFSR